jgi:hypothetical protein
MTLIGRAVPGGTMHFLPATTRPLQMLSLAVLFSLGIAGIAGAQSQEPKPVLPATPVAGADVSPADGTATGVTGSTWTGPNWGVGVSWDPSIWTVATEFIDAGYDGIQLGTPLSTVYLEAYEGFGGDAAACLADAEAEIAARQGVTEVVPLTGRPLPVPEEVRGEAQLFGITLVIEDGTTFRGVEYVECRTLVPGSAVLEITWQTLTETFNQDFTNVEALLATITVPNDAPPAATPVA